MPRLRSVSFAAAAFNAVYYIGVVHYLHTHPRRLAPDCLFLGSSSGSVMGPLLVCGVGLRRIMERVVPFLEESHRLKNFWASARRFIRTVFSLLPHDAHRRCSRRCAVVYTKVALDTFTAVRRARFRSRRHLYRCIRASCCIPLVTDLAPIRMGPDHVGIDGTFSDTQPVVDAFTLRVNATHQRSAGRADIHPPPEVTSPRPALMELPPMDQVARIVRQGYADARHYLEGAAPPAFRLPPLHVHTAPEKSLPPGEVRSDGAQPDPQLPHPEVHHGERL